MRIRNLFKIATVMLVMAFAMPTYSNAAAITSSVRDSSKDARVLSDIINRVTEIQNMDKTNLSASEKTSLKKELKDMKRKADGLDKRVYLSVGAIIIIILILILILK